MTDLSEEAATALAAMVLSVKSGAISVDVAVGTAYGVGRLAGRVEGLEMAQQIFKGDKQP